MASLKFQDVIGFYQANNNAVYKDLKAAYLGGKLTPFVGAGLSVFCGYKLWPSVLKELSAFIPDEGLKQKALDMIEGFKYLEAAEHIQTQYPPMLRRLLGIVSYNKLETCPDERLYSSAAWLLPYLFHNRPLMTTNFDGVLEYVFSRQDHAFERMVEPHDPSMLTQIRQQDIHGLFKLHGDIGRETTSLDRLVFTKKQYDAAYCENGKLMEELKQWYQNQTLLFLGCSLSMDKTMEVLQDVASKNPGIRHFAIVGCDPKKYGEFLNRFGVLGIDAIFYDDTNPKNHDAVRVILENLLYETNQDAYQKLDDEMRRFVGPVKRDDVLMYDAGRIKYVGRTAELADLERFCSSQYTNAWWAVTGPGGMGKSRLIYEFTNQKQNEGWSILWFSRDQYDRLTELSLPSENTIVVLDDVQADTQTAGAWLNAMRNHRRINRLRILMIEREGTEYASADWLRVLRSGNPYNDPLADWCYNKTFLHLEPLTDDDLKAIMSSCADALGKTIDPESLLTALDRVDGELRRPLYALAVAEAACNGDDPLRWDPNRVLDEMLNRELSFHYECLQYTLREQPTASLQDELELLMARCCIHGHIPLTAVSGNQYPYLTGCMGRRSPTEFFRCLGLLHTENDTPVLRMNCPDLIREHLVLRLAFEHKTLDLLPDGWYEEPERFFFLYRLWCNHTERLRDQSDFWDRFFSAPSANDIYNQLYAKLLWSCTYHFPSHTQQAVDTLEARYKNDPGNERTAVYLAHCLFNLTCYQKSPQNRADTVLRLERLYDTHRDNQEIALDYANGLVNLTFGQDSPQECADTVLRLERLYDAHRDNQEIALRYAKGLLNLTFVQDSPQECADTVRCLECLYDTHRDNQEIALEYAKGLYNLSYLQKAPQELADIALCLENLHKTYLDNAKIARNYAGLLVDLALAQTEEPPVREILLKSGSILDKHLENPEIQLSHAKTWFNLTLVQPEGAIPSTVSDIAAFLKAHPDAIPEFREALDKYLAKHPDHEDRYLLLKNLGGDSHA